MSTWGIATAVNRLSDATAEHPYSFIALMVGAVTGVGFAAFDVLRSANIEALYLLVVFASASKWGRRPGLVAALVSFIVFDFCFIPPRFSVVITDLAYVVTLVVFVVVAVATSELASRAHREQSGRTKAEAAIQARDALLNRVAHELRAPLTTIAGWVHILQTTDGDAKRTARGLAGLERNAELLERLVGDLLDVSRIHHGTLRVEVEPVTLAPIVRRALEDASIVAAEKGVTLDSDIEAVGTVLADEHRVEQVVTNLVSNALKFTPAKGRISVTLSRTDHHARLVVSDTGEGIPSEFLPHIFEPFSQGHPKNSVQGLGLGLAIVKHLVDAHHGRISVQSAGRGRGATFVVDLPLATDTADPAIQGHGRPAAVKKRG